MTTQSNRASARRPTVSRTDRGSTTPTMPDHPAELGVPALSPDALYTPEEVGRFLKIPHRTLERWRGLERGPKFMYIGRRPRYLGRDVIEFVKKLRAANGRTA